MLVAADTDKNPPEVGSFAGQQGYIVIAYLKRGGGGQESLRTTVCGFVVTQIEDLGNN